MFKNGVKGWSFEHQVGVNRALLGGNKTTLEKPFHFSTVTEVNRYAV